jgi:transcription elongation factor Elf1
MNRTSRDAELNSTFRDYDDLLALDGQQEVGGWAHYGLLGDTAGLQTTSSDYGQYEGSETRHDYGTFEHTQEPWAYTDVMEDSSAFQTGAPEVDQLGLGSWPHLYADTESNRPWSHLHTRTDATSSQSEHYVPGISSFDDLQRGREFDEYTLRPFRGGASSPISHTTVSTSLGMSSTSPLAYNPDLIDASFTPDDYATRAGLYDPRIVPTHFVSVPDGIWTSSPADPPSSVSNSRRSGSMTVHQHRQLSSHYPYIGAHLTMPELDQGWTDDEYGPYMATAPLSGTPGSSASYYGTSTTHTQDVAECSRDDLFNTEGDSLTCDICDKSFQRPADLRRHMQKHDEPEYFCEVPGCGREFYRKDKLRDHVRQAHKGNIITSDGGLEFDVPERANTPSTFSCTDCREVFSTPGLLKKHVNRKHVRRFACGTCDATFHLNADLKRHKFNVHERSLRERHACPSTGCSFTTSRRDNLRRHTLTRHS